MGTGSFFALTTELGPASPIDSRTASSIYQLLSLQLTLIASFIRAKLNRPPREETTAAVKVSKFNLRASTALIRSACSHTLGIWHFRK